ncbi:putative metal-dependent hydrolase [Paenibacillus sp. P96]|uniref:Metal-dependent hydrolase n=1 Tax=Paenibacillus zeirhizosphaerae TaxID=2987519 RepID=A0ABT9FSN7_9BACL|nr:putative metal-dependent hydrolase [Paenibacillus sp. P96]MDP4097640.1 putative metal-dependent hydrolase [Paenibacillus sp. P96]
MNQADDELRYPVGKFESVPTPDTAQRAAYIKEIAEMPRILRELVQDLTPGQLRTPYRPGGWTVLQVIHHLADNDMNAYIRFRRGLTEDNPVISGYRQDLWAQQEDYSTEAAKTSLLLIEAVHGRFTALLHTLGEEDYQRTFRNEQLGSMTLDTALQRYAWHGRHHMAQIRSLVEHEGWKA